MVLREHRKRVARIDILLAAADVHDRRRGR
jgi:hypothetical protein